MQHRPAALFVSIFSVCILVTGSLCSAVAENAQQTKMKDCNAKAATMKGDERKAFMKECLSAKPAAKLTQQDKMKQCNVDATAKSLKGDDRKAFMKECLSAKPAA